jgi:hypothetical protein
MPFQKVEYSFPDEEEMSTDIEIEDSGALEVDISGKAPDPKFNVETKEEEGEEEYELEIIDDTPKADQNREPSEPPIDVTDEELEGYSQKVRNRLKHFSKGYHDERRAKESAQREREELERYAQQVLDENRQLKGSVNKNQTALLDQAKKNTDVEIASAKKAYGDAHEAGDTEALVEAQETLTNAKIKSDRLNNLKLPSLQEEETPVQLTGNESVTPSSTSDDAVTPRGETWMQENSSWFGVDDELTGFAMGVHNKLVKEYGQNYAQTEEYYETINTRMQKMFPEQFGDAPKVGKPKRQSNVVAPATRSTAPKKVTLNKSQQAIADKLGVITL